MSLLSGLNGSVELKPEMTLVGVAEAAWNLAVVLALKTMKSESASSVGTMKQLHPVARTVLFVQS